MTTPPQLSLSTSIQNQNSNSINNSQQRQNSVGGDSSNGNNLNAYQQQPQAQSQPFNNQQYSSNNYEQQTVQNNSGNNELVTNNVNNATNNSYYSTPQVLSQGYTTSNTTGVKASLKFEGNIEDVTLNWTDEEQNNRRRLVQFRPHYKGNAIHCYFNVISQNERAATNTTVLSCIYWDMKQDFYITSVDCIYLLEALLAVRFTVEEKNRIRRNLEGFRPNTISKCKQETSEFFKLIMSFPNPKPRNIEKDVKVFPWKILPYALKKIIDKYTSNTGITNSNISTSMNSGGLQSQQHTTLFQPPNLSQYTSYASTPFGYDGQGTITPHNSGPIRGLNAVSSNTYPYQRRYSQPVHNLGSNGSLNNRIRPLNIAATNQFYSSIKEEPNTGMSIDNNNEFNNVNNQAQQQHTPHSANLLPNNNNSSLNTPFMGNNNSNSATNEQQLLTNNNMMSNNSNNLMGYSTATNNNYNVMSSFNNMLENNLMNNSNSYNRNMLYYNRRHSLADPYSIQKLQYFNNTNNNNNSNYYNENNNEFYNSNNSNGNHNNNDSTLANSYEQNNNNENNTDYNNNERQ